MGDRPNLGYRRALARTLDLAMMGMAQRHAVDLAIVAPALSDRDGVMGLHTIGGRGAARHHATPARLSQRVRSEARTHRP
jgi:hypothetical protein